MNKAPIIDVFIYNRFIGGITIDQKKRFSYLPADSEDGSEAIRFMQNLIASAQGRIPGRVTGVQLLLKLPLFYKGVVYAEIRSEKQPFDSTENA